MTLLFRPISSSAACISAIVFFLLGNVGSSVGSTRLCWAGSGIFVPIALIWCLHRPWNIPWGQLHDHVPSALWITVYTTPGVLSDGILKNCAGFIFSSRSVRLSKCHTLRLLPLCIRGSGCCRGVMDSSGMPLRAFWCCRRRLQCSLRRCSSCIRPLS